ncbi:uncharacterized protein LOC123265285 [Cotesia glomerata]|uniref:Uncharacterized protein n=1 Tax=Cotesia glomerata TaxID=32391 RepID=A0AAV7IY86_COTGL|nr:uncharacterized protein LOC123265285 [Cotesia glomerata]KAH0560318.1 hypothetical protein KQX54_003493 [Cotesia glomerata]
MAALSANKNIEIFYKAIADKKIDIIKQCLKDEILMIITDRCVRPPLHQAIWSGSKEIVELILKEVDDIDRVDSFGRSALHIAVQNGYEDIVPILLNEGANINITCRRKKPALSYAIDRIDSLRHELSKQRNHKNNLIFRYHHDLYQYIQIAEYIEEYLIKLEAMNLYISHENYKLITGYMNIEYEEEEYANMELDINFVPKNLHQKCEEEFNVIKNEKIKGYNISFYDILIDYTFDDNQLSKFAKILFGENFDYKRKFKLYYGIIKNRLKRGIERNKLLLHYDLEFNGKNDYYFFGDIQLPIYCITAILKYLGNEDLKILIEADRLPSSSECSVISSKIEGQNIVTNKRKIDGKEEIETKKICLIKKHPSPLKK